MPAPDHRTSNRPTPKQLRLLRQLAERSGTTFMFPSNRKRASEQISALQRRGRSSRLERALDQQAVRGGDLFVDG